MTINQKRLNNILVQIDIQTIKTLLAICNYRNSRHSKYLISLE